jgi:hypothetical protein
MRDVHGVSFAYPALGERSGLEGERQHQPRMASASDSAMPMKRDALQLAARLRLAGDTVMKAAKTMPTPMPGRWRRGRNRSRSGYR